MESYIFYKQIYEHLWQLSRQYYSNRFIFISFPIVFSTYCDASQTILSAGTIILIYCLLAFSSDNFQDIFCTTFPNPAILNKCPWWIYLQMTSSLVLGLHFLPFPCIFCIFKKRKTFSKLQGKISTLLYLILGRGRNKFRLGKIPPLISLY